MKAVVRELVRCDIAPEVACGCTLGQQIPYEAPQVMFRSGDVVTLVQDRRELVAVVLMEDQGVGIENGLETIVRATGSVPKLGELLEVAPDLPLVPRDQNRLDV